jgi:hypothetical protein
MQTKPSATNGKPHSRPRSVLQLKGPAPERTMAASSILSRGTTSVTLQWENSSPWPNPHPNGLYTFPVSFGVDNDCQVDIEFFVSGMRLILKRAYHFHNGDQISYYNMGEFVDTVDTKVAVQKIKQYAQYVIDGYAQSGNLLHCPSFERMDDVDDNFNPL